MKSLLKNMTFGLFIVISANATIINVPTDQPTIQAGINSAFDGDTVLVDNGTYIENINFNGKNIVVASQFLNTPDESHISQTVIDGDSSGCVVTFETGENSTTRLIGFTITNGKGTGWPEPEYTGGGITCKESSKPSLENLIVIKNSAPEGGGIYCDNSNPNLENVTISRNSAEGGGGGMYCLYSDPNLTNIIISENSTGWAGGAILCWESNPTAVNVTVSKNVADLFGGGIYCRQNSNPRLVNVILWNNSPQEIYLSGSENSNSILVAFSDVEHGEEGIEINNNAVNWLEGNVDVAPLFVDAENADFHLLEDSPCIDSGIALFINEGDTLINLSQNKYIGSAPDIGACEFGTISIEDYLFLAPKEFSLYQNYPNPFNPETTINYELPEQSQVLINIYDILGREIRTLVNDFQDAGYKSVIWDGTDEFGRSVGTGIYLYQIKASGFTQTKKMVLLK